MAYQSSFYVVDSRQIHLESILAVILYVSNVNFLNVGGGGVGVVFSSCSDLLHVITFAISYSVRVTGYSTLWNTPIMLVTGKTEILD